LPLSWTVTPAVAGGYAQWRALRVLAQHLHNAAVAGGGLARLVATATPTAAAADLGAPAECGGGPAELWVFTALLVLSVALLPGAVEEH
jgi:hypothetical protein